MKDKDFLIWLADRLEYVYEEDPNTDFVQKLRAIAVDTSYHKDTSPYLAQFFNKEKENMNNIKETLDSL